MEKLQAAYFLEYGHARDAILQQAKESFRRMWHDYLGADDPPFEEFSYAAQIDAKLLETLDAKFPIEYPKVPRKNQVLMMIFQSAIQEEMTKIKSEEFQQQKAQEIVLAIAPNYMDAMRKEIQTYTERRHFKKFVYVLGVTGVGLLVFSAMRR